MQVYLRGSGAQTDELGGQELLGVTGGGKRVSFWGEGKLNDLVADGG